MSLGLSQMYILRLPARVSSPPMIMMSRRATERGCYQVECLLCGRVLDGEVGLSSACTWVDFQVQPTKEKQ
eukprot:7951630-Prorocentrum_lima.AAC.1